MDFIFMLTRSDRTVEDALEVLGEVLPVGLTHIGFKDVGVSHQVMAELVARIRDAGAVSYLEVVSTDAASCLRSAETAAELGFDRLLGGTDIAGMLAALEGTEVTYYPFPGRPFDHPTRLGGDAALVEEQCREFMLAGCGGVDLLAYRATEAEPLDLVRAARRGLGEGLLICAGSVATREQIRDLAEAGCDAFTIGTAAFAGEFSPTKGSLRSQIRDILEACV